MQKVPLNNIITKIHAEKGISIEDINKKIASKVQELSGLVSEEGAAHIIANELGVAIFGENDVKIKEIMPNMRDIIVMGKIVALYDMVTFQRESKPGRVRSLLLGDETGRIRASFWQDAADVLEDMAVGDILSLKGVISRENNKQAELSVTKVDTIEKNPEGVEIEVAVAATSSAARRIVDLHPGPGSIIGTIVQAYRPTFYFRCPECNKKVLEGKCAIHGNVDQKKACILNLTVDDGTGAMRCVCFNELAEKITGMTLEELENVDKVRDAVLGNIKKFSGNVRYSQFLNENEIILNSIDEVDFEVEVKELDTALT